MKDIILKKENGVIVEIAKTPEAVAEIKAKEVPHLCWEHCDKGYVCKCEKIADIEKKEIGEYSFITDGYQVYDEEGNTEILMVTGCSNYKVEEQKVQTTEEKERLKKLKEGIRMAYFEAGSIEEAHIIQYELEKRGQLSNIRGKRPSEAQVKKLIIEITKVNSTYTIYPTITGILPTNI